MLNNELIAKLVLSPFIFFFLISIFIPLVAEAQIKIENPLKYETLKELIDAIVKFIFNLALWVAPIMYLVSAFYYLTAGGDPQKIETAKKIIIYTSIGLIIAIAAKGLISVFREIFTPLPTDVQ